MSVPPKPPAITIRFAVEQPIQLRFENCRTDEDRERVAVWLGSVPGLADVLGRLAKINQAGRQ